MILITLLCVLASSESLGTDAPGEESNEYYPNVLTDMDCRGSGWEDVSYGLDGSGDGTEGRFLEMKCYIDVLAKGEYGKGTEMCKRKWEENGRTYYGCDDRSDHKGSHWCYTASDWDYCSWDVEEHKKTEKDVFYCVGSDDRESSPHNNHEMRCGYSYLPSNKIKDDQEVLSDVRMFVCDGHKGHSKKKACDCPSEGNWVAKMHFDSLKSGNSVEGERKRKVGKYAVLCAQIETYADVKSRGQKLITGMGVLLKNDVPGDREVIGTHIGRKGNKKYYHNSQQGRDTRDNDEIRFYVEREGNVGPKVSHFGKTYGIWRLGPSGNGKGSRTVSREMQFSEGFSTSTEQTEAYASSIGHEASISLTLGYESPSVAGSGTFSASVTAGYKFNQETSREAALAVGRIAEESVSNTKSESCTVETPDSITGDSGWTMWVFEIVGEAKGKNAGKTASLKMCTAWFKTGPCKATTPPKCLPGYCADADCNECDVEEMAMNQNYEKCESEVNLLENFSLESVHSSFDTVFGLFPEGGMSWLSFGVLLLLILSISITACCCCCRQRALATTQKYAEQPPCCC